MDKRERLRLGLMIDRVQEWVTKYSQVTGVRDAVKDAAQLAVKTLRKREVSVWLDGCEDESAPFMVLGLEPGDTKLLTALARYVRLPAISDDDAALLQQLTGEVPDALRDARRAADGPGVFGRKQLDEDALDGAEFIFEYGQWGQGEGLAEVIAKIAAPPADEVKVTLEQALDPSVGLVALLVKHGTPELVAGSVFADLPEALAGLRANTSYGESIDGALAPVEALEPLASGLPAGVEQVIICSPAGKKVAELLAQVTAVTAG